MFSASPAEKFDVVVVGCGPGGAVAATHLAGAGLSVLALERHRFPRYHIGESLTGTGGDFIRELGLDRAMKECCFPEKTGVKVIGRGARSEFFVPVLRPTWQVRRDEFDAILLERALESGVTHRWGSVKRILKDDSGRVTGVAYRPLGSETDVLIEIECRFLIDASGHSTLLARHGVAGPMRVDAFGRQLAVFSQFTGVERDAGKMGDNTLIFYSETHHWAWMIPLSSEVVSIGVVIPASTYKSHGPPPESVMRWGLEEINPDLASRMKTAEAVEPVRVIRNYSYRVDPFVGPGWICIGDSHRFADPIFSFGVSFAMSEAKAAALAIVEACEIGDSTEPFARYCAWSDRGQERAYDLIRYFWRFPAFFSFQTRSKMRQDYIRLLAGDCFGEEELDAMRAMRVSLQDISALGIRPGVGRDVAQRVYDRYADFQGVEAAFLKQDDEGMRLSLFLTDDDVDLYDHLSDFEERLYAEFGRNQLAVLSYTPLVLAPRAEPPRGPLPVTPPAHAFIDSGDRIFDRRAR